MIKHLKGYDIEINGEMLTISNESSAQSITTHSPYAIVLIEALKLVERQHIVLNHVERGLERAYERD